MEQRIPIDIHYNKLLDWLIDRRHCSLKWQQSALEVRKKINTALQDMPPNEDIKKLLSGAYINYFHCMKIVDLLKKCGEGSTNFFGQYSSQRMKDWIEITQYYKEDNIHLAEAAHLLIRNVNYEIPSLKRQIGKCQQTQRDCSRKETEYTSNAAIFKEKYYHVCKQMGVHGDNVKQELLSLVSELSELFERISEKTSGLEDTIEYYAAFIAFVVPKNSSNNDNDNNETNDFVPMITFISKYGNATVYQWRTGKIPRGVEKENASANKVDSNEETETDTSNGGIDFGDQGDAIDFGENDGGAIDWDDNGISVVADGGIDYGIEAVNEIDYGIEAVDITVEDAGIEIVKNPIDEKSQQDSEVAKGTDALSVMEHAATRNLFIDELIEMQSFLSQRLDEMSTEGDILSANLFQSAAVIIQMQTKGNIRDMHLKVQTIIEDLTSMKMQNLYRLKGSPRYVDRLTESLQQKLKIATNLLKQASVMVERKQAALDLQRETEPQLELITEKTKDLQKQISEEISSKYNSRIVNIMGEINAI